MTLSPTKTIEKKKFLGVESTQGHWRAKQLFGPSQDGQPKANKKISYPGRAGSECRTLHLPQGARPPPPPHGEAGRTGLPVVDGRNHWHPNFQSLLVHSMSILHPRTAPSDFVRVAPVQTRPGSKQPVQSSHCSPD